MTLSDISRPGVAASPFSPGKDAEALDQGARMAIVVFLAAIVLAWQFCSLLMPPVLMPSPMRVASRFWEMWFDPSFLYYAGLSVFHVVSAVILAFATGVATTLFVYFFPIFDTALYGRIAPFLNSFSGIGWAFLSLIWFGINSGSVIFCATIALLPMTLINAGAGLRAMNAEIIEMSVSYGRSPFRRIRLVILPLMYPYLLATLRLLFGISWQVVLVAELLCGTGGLGTLISVSRQRFATDMILAIALLIFALVYLIDRVVFAAVQQRLRKTYDV